ncbi:MAG: hypothetical protein KAR20_20645, partial [Candidatus Heimdallarchaeota archaeon]|nr:hypothetical protein [Candidatus Heimdallarchaeota archaeon]
IKNANHALLKIHGAASLEDFLAVEEDPSHWWSDYWSDVYIDEIVALSESNGTFEAECLDTRLNETKFELRMIAQVVGGYEDSWERVIHIVEDISARKRVEAELIEARFVAEKANAAKTEFLSNMSHELRTPLNAIIGFSKILGKHKNINDKQKQQLNTIRGSGEHLLALINDILDYGKIEMGKIQAEKESLNLHSIIFQSFNIVKIKADEKNLPIYLDIKPKVPQYVNSFERALKQILLNVLSNAVKYTLKGTVWFRCWHTFEKDQDLFHFQIEDTGMGIPDSKLKEIFQPFMQVGRKSKNIQGTGLGLSVVDQLVKVLKGSLDVKSEVDKGSVFTVILPMEVIDESYNIEKKFEQENIIGFKGEK